MPILFSLYQILIQTNMINNRGLIFMDIKQTTDLSSPTYRDALNIRQTVFVVEQQVPAELEIDAFENQARYFVGYDQGQPVATLRLIDEGHAYHVQRVAVAKTARHRGYGQLLMQSAADFAEKVGKQSLILNAQLTALPFYQKLGFHATATPTFVEAGIEHQEMAKSFKNDSNSL